jgi:hypothetical protein
MVTVMPPARLSRVNLGGVGLAHIKNHLRGYSKYTAGKPMRRALAKLPLERGYAWTWAPEGWAPTLEDLHAGSLPGGISQTHHRNLLVDFAVKYLTANERLVLIEDEVATPQDPSRTERPVLPQRLGFGKHVYWYATESNGRVVREVMACGLGFSQCMVLAKRGGHWPPTSGVNSTQIANLANVADHFVVDAFDFWGTVVWSRHT